MPIQYPRLDDATLIPFRAIEALLKQTPDLLQRDDCPYSASVREFLVTRLGKGEFKKIDYSDDDLETEIADLYTELKRAGLSVTMSDPKDKIAMLKTASELLTKLVSLKERIQNVRQMGQFQRTVVELMERILTPAQRSNFVDSLGSYLDLRNTRTSLLGQEHPGDPASSQGEGPPA
jgi:hypothetical protein